MRAVVTRLRPSCRICTLSQENDVRNDTIFTAYFHLHMSSLDELPTENTPLLNQHVPKQTPVFVHDLERSISSAIGRTSGVDVNDFQSEIHHALRNLGIEGSQKASLELLLLLRLSGSDGYSRFYAALDASSVDSALDQAWTNLQDRCSSTEELSSCLWLQFQLEEGLGSNVTR